VYSQTFIMSFMPTYLHLVKIEFILFGPYLFLFYQSTIPRY